MSSEVMLWWVALGIAGSPGFARVPCWRRLGMEVVSEGFDLDWVDCLEIFAVVGWGGEVVVEGGASNWEVRNAGGFSFDLRFAGFSVEQEAIGNLGVVAETAPRKPMVAVRAASLDGRSVPRTAGFRRDDGCAGGLRIGLVADCGFRGSLAVSLRWHPLKFPLREREGKGCVARRGEGVRAVRGGLLLR